MKKVLIGIKDNALTFKYKKSADKIDNNLVNTNIITHNELVFNEEYIEENKRIVIGFVRELIDQYNIKQLIIKESDLTFTALDLINNNDKVKAIFFREEKQLTFEICEKVLTNKHIRIINCYNMPPYMLECFDQRGIKTESRSEIMFTSAFMQGNNLLQYSKIFYKLSVRIEFPLKNQDLEDFKIFCRINKYLRSIHVNKYSKSELEKIICILKEEKIKNVKIYVHDNVNKESDINSLKKLNNKHKRSKIKIELKYSDTYLKDNLFKQVVVNVLKVCGLLTFFLVTTFISYVLISNYRAMKRVNKIKAEINEVVEKTDSTQVIEELNKEKEENEPLVSNGYVASLLQLNPQTVGWINIKNTNIDYPVVQATNNKYYLDHNFNFEEDRDGWVYMDYRDDPINLSKNTIIYAHNRYYSGVMFGSLYKATYKSWYTNKENQIIKFDTLYGEHKWKIFSIYNTPVTSDYLQVKFDSDEEWLMFIQSLKQKSIYDFGVSINTEDKILTLSTCAPKGRLVVHAVMIE